ncbi:MAG: hypothetical protein ACOCYX_02675 [Spirochaetota bacterium]
MRNSFVASLAVMDTLSNEEVAERLRDYAAGIDEELAMWRERLRRSGESAGRDARIRRAIHERWIAYYENEMRWATYLAQEMDASATEKSNDD